MPSPPIRPTSWDPPLGSKIFIASWIAGIFTLKSSCLHSMSLEGDRHLFTLPFECSRTSCRIRWTAARLQTLTPCPHLFCRLQPHLHLAHDSSRLCPQDGCTPCLGVGSLLTSNNPENYTAPHYVSTLRLTVWFVYSLQASLTCPKINLVYLHNSRWCPVVFHSWNSWLSELTTHVCTSMIIFFSFSFVLGRCNCLSVLQS